MTSRELSEFTMFNGVYWKIPVSCFIGALTFSEEEWKFVLAILFVLVVDTISGLIASLLEGKKITSAKLSRFAVKVFLYFGGVIALKSVENAFPIVGGHLVRAYALFVIVTEVLSFFENIERSGIKPSLKKAKKYIKFYKQLREIK